SEISREILRQKRLRMTVVKNSFPDEEPSKDAGSSYFTRSPDGPITRFFSGLLRRRRIALLRPWRRLLLLAFYLFWRREDGMQRVSFHSRTELHYRALANFFQQALEHLASQIGMGHFAAAEEDGGLYLVALLEKAQYVVLFELVVVLVH